MSDPSELDPDALKVALDAAEVLLRFRAYTTPGGLLVLILGKFRDDLRAALGMDAGLPAGRGNERRSLDDLGSIELDTVGGAVMILLQPRFTRLMDDPELAVLLRDLEDALNVEKARRKKLREESQREARAS